MCEELIESYDIRPMNNVKRTRVILDQLVPGIVGDILENGLEEYKMNYLYRLRDRAYRLVNEQERYTELDIHTAFEDAYNTIDIFIKKT